MLQRLHDAPGGGEGGYSHDFLGYSHYTSVKQTNKPTDLMSLGLMFNDQQYIGALSNVAVLQRLAV